VLTRRASVALPANVQYAWPHASRRFLYVATSDSASGMGPAGTNHHLTALRIDPASGALSPHGAPVALPHRPIHMATDVPSEYALVAFNNPPSLGVWRINPDGTPGQAVPQPGVTDPGIFPHQVLATPDNRLVILVARGFDAARGKPEEPGALKLFGWKDGQLTPTQSIEPDGGFGFGPRHLDFHPTRPWIYVSLERQNEVAMFERDGDKLAATPKFRRTTLAEPGNIRSRPVVGTVHVHPNGRTVYVANRASDTVESGGRKLFKGGENSLAVYAIDQATGEPVLIQNADTHGIHPRTFHIDPSGRMLVVAHIMGLDLQDGSSVPVRLTTFRIAADGTLTFAKSYDIENAGRFMWWMGMVAW
jgi:6-phosphogluconolactonase (cycloisomerase 2 family)